MDFLNFILLDGVPAAGEKAQNPYSMWIMLGLLMVVFYFFMIRPQSKKQKELKKFRESLAEGSKVVTVGGIHGKVAQIKDNTVLLEVAENVRIKIDKASIVQDTITNQQSQPAAK
ncbi:MAG: preprotein translocase subunit YajC [Bacteroidales bacterium]|nr:preprotein translocase subunit YajC [Bacteroidales bacterium]